jgi:hypothetical protein
MPASVTDAVFLKRDLFRREFSDDAAAPTGMQSGSGINKQPRQAGSVSRLSQLAQNVAVDASGLSTMSPAQAQRWLKTDEVMRALGVIEVCTQRLGQLALAYHGPPPQKDENGFSLYEGMKEYDPVTTSVYQAERERLNGLIDAARNDLDKIYGENVGPPLNLDLATAQRKAANLQI